MRTRRPHDPLALRSPVGFATLGVGASVVGAVIVALLLWLLGIPQRLGDSESTVAAAGAGYVLLAVVAGSTWATRLQYRAVRWWDVHGQPSEADAHRALRLPAMMALIPATLWLAGTALAAAVAGSLAPGWDALGVALSVALGGVGTTGITYLLAERAARPVLASALGVLPPAGPPRFTVLGRLVLVWLLASGLPLSDVLLVLALPNATPEQRLRGAIFLGAVGLVTGGIATVLLARAVSSPLRRMRAAVHEITLGHTDVSVSVDNTTEIGLLQSAVNDMVRGLRERRRMQDLFGRHVGNEVAEHALRVGASLSGDVRDVTALFVDVVDSTALASSIPPDEVVGKLNRFFSTVVEAADANDGLVNKFAGDAALCIFGAPAAIRQPQQAALHAARRIRDAVRADGELDLGIGIACGEAFAGQLGSSHRFEYTVIGDPVNEAARLTEHAKQLPGRVLASAAVLDGATEEERRCWGFHDEIALRGRRDPTVVWAARP